MSNIRKTALLSVISFVSSFAVSSAFAQSNNKPAAVPESNQSKIVPTSQNTIANTEKTNTEVTHQTKNGVRITKTTVTTTSDQKTFDHNDNTPFIQSDWNVKKKNLSSDHHWKLKLYGYIRTQLQFIRNPLTNASGIGLHDGFFIANARVGLKGTVYKWFGFNFAIDGAGTADIKGKVKAVAEMKDAYITFQPFPFIGARVGLFIPPFDAEGLLSTSTRKFADLSVASRGVKKNEGKLVEGLSRGSREAGIAIGARDFYPMSEDNSRKGLGLSYEFAVTNGNSATDIYNDDEQMAYYGRIALNWEKYVTVGFGAYYNSMITERTSGTYDSYNKKNNIGIAADLAAEFYGVHLLVDYMMVKNSKFSVQNGKENEDNKGKFTSQGLNAEIAFSHKALFGFEPAYRFSFNDPNNALNSDRVIAHTIGLNWELPEYPFRAVFNYTFINEQGSKKIRNNRIDLVFQMKW